VAPWLVECPEVLEIAPAELVAVTVLRMDLFAPDVFMWVEGHDEPYPLAGIAELPADPSDPMAAPRHTITFALPTLEEGLYRVSFGSEMAIRSNAVELSLVHPERRYTQEEAAALIERGIGLMADDLEAFFNSPEPEWQQMLDELYEPDMRATIAAEFEIARELGRTLRADYMALSEDEERLLQAALEGSGFLESLDRIEAGGAHFPDRVPLLRDFGLVTAHRVAMQLDAYSTGVDLLGIALDVVSVAALLTGVGAPAAAVSVGVRVSVAFIKGIVDTFVPTDLAELELHADHDQEAFFGGTMIPWGTFQTQNTAGGATRAVGDIIAELLSSVIPVERGQIVEAGVNFLNSVLVRLGFAATYLSDRLDDSRLVSVTFKAPVDMEAYNLSVGAALMRTPIIGPKLADVLWFLNAISVRDSVRLSGGVPAAWFEDAFVHQVFWSNVGIRDVRFPGAETVERGAAIIELNAFAFETRPAWFGTAPRLRWVSLVPDAINVQSVVDPDDPNDRRDLNDNIFYTHTSGTRPIFGLAPITRSTETVRNYSMRIWHAGGFFGDASVEVEVNGASVTTVTPGRFFSGREATPTIALALVPGKNEVRVINRNPRVSSCSISGLTSSGSGCLVVTFDEAANVDPQHPLFMGETADGSYTFTVWAPPAYE
jgi:hypothetical protein